MAKIYLSIFLLFQFNFEVLAQTEISLETKVTEVNSERVEDLIRSIEMIDDTYASVSWNSTEVFLTFLSDIMGIQTQKRIKIFDFYTDSLRIEEVYFKEDEAFVLTKRLLVSKNKIQYWIQKIDLENFKRVEDKILISEAIVDGYFGFYGHSLNLDFNGSIFSIFSIYRDESNIQNGLLKIYDEDFEIVEDKKFLLEKLKPTHANYLRIIDVYSYNKKAYFLVSGSKLKSGFSNRELVTGIITFDKNGDIISKTVLPNEEVRQYDNLSIKGVGDNVYIAGTFQGNKANPSENGFYLGVLDSESGELIHNSQTSADQVYNYENLSGSLKRMMKATKNYDVFNYIFRKSKIFFLENGVTVIHQLSGFDGQSMTYFRPDAILSYESSGEIIRKKYLQQNFAYSNTNPSLHLRFYIQISNNQLLVFYAKRLEDYGKNVSLSEEPFFYIKNNSTKSSVPVYSVIDSDLNISKPKLVMPVGPDKNLMHINLINSYIFNKGSEIEIITFLQEFKKNKLLFCKIYISP